MTTDTDNSPPAPPGDGSQSQPQGPFYCTEADCKHSTEPFLRSEELDRHRGTHEGRPFPCTWPACGKNLATKQGLKDHFNYQHLGIKAYLCEICGTSFSNRPNHFRHRVSDHGHMPAPRARRKRQRPLSSEDDDQGPRPKKSRRSRRASFASSSSGPWKESSLTFSANVSPPTSPFGPHTHQKRQRPLSSEDKDQDPRPKRARGSSASSPPDHWSEPSPTFSVNVSSPLGSPSSFMSVFSATPSPSTSSFPVTPSSPFPLPLTPALSSPNPRPSMSEYLPMVCSTATDAPFLAEVLPQIPLDIAPLVPLDPIDLIDVDFWATFASALSSDQNSSLLQEIFSGMGYYRQGTRCQIVALMRNCKGRGTLPVPLLQNGSTSYLQVQSNIIPFMPAQQLPVFTDSHHGACYPESTPPLLLLAPIDGPYSNDNYSTESIDNTSTFPIIAGDNQLLSSWNTNSSTVPTNPSFPSDPVSQPDAPSTYSDVHEPAYSLLLPQDYTTPIASQEDLGLYFSDSNGTYNSDSSSAESPPQSWDDFISSMFSEANVPPFNIPAPTTVGYGQASDVSADGSSIWGLMNFLPS